jgi:hypothetical protein
MSRSARENANEPGYGPEVKPGRYTLVYTLGSHIDTAYVTVHDDPRALARDWAAQHAFEAEVNGQMAALDSSVTQLREAKKRLELLDKLVAANQDTAATKQLRADIKAQLKSIEDRRMALFGKEDVKGYFEQPETWEWKYGQFSGHYWSLRGAPSPNMLNAWKSAKAASEAELKALSTWATEVWKPFTEKYASLPIW